MWLTLRYFIPAKANNNNNNNNVVVGVLKLLLLLLVTVDCLDYRGVLAQSNYVQHGDSGNYTTNGLPEETTLDGKVTKLDDISPLIFLNRTKAALNCAAGSMQVDMKFNEPFHGIIQAEYDRSSACRVNGKGALSYKFELPLKGCGTLQNPTRVFTNNIIVRFHANLEMDGDEIITIVCRYPPPIPSLPPALPAPILNPIMTGNIIQPPLKGIQILMIICAIMFLTLLLLGLAVSYYCLRRRPVAIVRHLPVSMGSSSEITKLSGSSVGGLDEFEGVKIPRAHAPLAVVHSCSSGSEGALIPSDYPSESHSEIEEIDTRSLPFSSAGSVDNRAFVHETSSIYSDHYGHTQEMHASNAMTISVPRVPNSPKFDVQVRVKKPPLPPPSPQTSDTESILTYGPTDRNNLSTIIETREDRESVITSMDDSPLPCHEEIVRQTQFTYTPDIHPVPDDDHVKAPPPVFSVYTRTTHCQMDDDRHETWSNYTDDNHLPSSSVMSDVTSQAPDIHSVTEMVDSTHFMETDYGHLPPIEPPIVIRRPQQQQQQQQEDIYRHTTITEKETIEDYESHQHKITTEYRKKTRVKPAPPPPPPPTVPESRWDVKIRNYPDETDDQRQKWENFSDISSTSGHTSLTSKMENHSQFNVPSMIPPPSSKPPPQIYDNKQKLTSPELVGNIRPIELPPEDKTVPNWDVLIRVLEEPEMYEVVDDSSSAHSSVHHPLTRYISYDDKAKWKEIITTESSLRTMLTEAVVREDFERIRCDTRYEKIFEPQTWDIIIRILAPPPSQLDDETEDIELRNAKLRNKKIQQPWDTRSRRSSLPTLYEYDSDGGSSVRTIRNDPINHSSNIGGNNFQRFRRSSRTSYNTDHNDFRSVSEVTVDFGRLDNMSNASSFYPMQYDDDDISDRRSSFHRSISHPSLARSSSEFIEHWIAPEDIISSPESTPKPRRSEILTSSYHQMPAPPTPPRSGRIVAQTQSEYMETRRSTYRSTESSTRTRDW